MTNIATIEQKDVGVLASLATDYGMDRMRFVETLKATVMGGKQVSNEQLAAFCLVAKSHGLNPFTKEIFAFPSNGGIVPVVSVDGWLKMINSHPQFDGMEFRDACDDKGALLSVTCRMFRKDRTHAIEVTEYMSECHRGTDTWKKWPARMLRHKATIQASRYAFGFAGIYEPDEAERIHEAEPVSAQYVPPAQLIGDERKDRCDAAAEQYMETLEVIRDAITREDWYTMTENWDTLPTSAQQDLWLAPTKGGWWTTYERTCLKEKRVIGAEPVA